MLHAFIAYSDLIGILGILGSVVLAIPFVSEATDRREWQLLVKFKQEVLNAQRTASPEEIEAHRQIRERIVDYRLGQYERFRLVTVWGFVLLFAAFISMTVARLSALSRFATRQFRPKKIEFAGSLCQFFPQQVLKSAYVFAIPS